MTVVVHHLERSRSHRVLWLLEEAGVDYEIKTYKRDPKTMRAPASLREVHPLGKAPVVELDGVVLAESGAIIDTLAERFAPHLAPGKDADADVARRYRFFMHYAEGSLMTPLFVALLTDKIRNAPVPFFIRPVAKGIAKNVDQAYTQGELRSHMSFLNAELGERPFLCGDALTGADVQMSYPLEAGASRIGIDAHRNIKAYLEKLRAFPAYQRALEKGGPVAL